MKPVDTSDPAEHSRQKKRIDHNRKDVPMRTKIGFALIGVACVVLITTAIYLGSLNGTEISAASATICVAMVAGFHLMEENNDKKQAD